MEDLQDQIAKGQVIVGAGVSIGATHNKPCASWTGLLHHGVDRCVEVVPGLPANWAQRVHAEIDSGDRDDLLSAAEKIATKLGASEETVQRLAPEAANIETLLLLGLESGYPAEVISTTFDWGEFVRFTGVGSARPLAQALYVAETSGDLQNAANCIYHLGNIALDRSDHAEARRRYEAALPLYPQVGDVLGEANCIQSLGDIALAQSDRAGAQQHFAEALVPYERIPEPYSIGAAHQRLARLTEGAERNHHVQAARTAWESIDRPDLVQQLEEKFGAGG